MAAPLTEISIVDLSQRQIRSFPAYRFLYERLIGGAVRPWLASSFGAAAVLPLLSPRHRGELIGTLAEDEVLRTDWPREEPVFRSEEHTSELQSLMRISYAVFCLKKKNKHKLIN